jgi:hypothetical protein
MFIFKIIGIIGLLLITFGVLQKKEITQDKFFILGGIFLGLYSLYIKDYIFISLQVVFVLATIYDLHKAKLK